MVGCSSQAPLIILCMLAPKEKESTFAFLPLREKELFLRPLISKCVNSIHWITTLCQSFHGQYLTDYSNNSVRHMNPILQKENLRPRDPELCRASHGWFNPSLLCPFVSLLGFAVPCVIVEAGGLLEAQILGEGTFPKGEILGRHTFLKFQFLNWKPTTYFLFL